MLILTRRQDQRIIIYGEDFNTVIVTVLQNTGGTVRLGFTADPSVNVDREEIYINKMGDFYEKHNI